MGSNDLNTWVSDKLMVLLGFSQTAVVQYLIAMAKQSKSPGELVRELVECGFSLSGDTRAFAEEIYARAPRKTPGVNLYQQQEAEAAMLLKKQKTFSLLEADHDEDENNVKKQSASKTGKSDKGQKRFRKKSEQLEDDDDEVVIVREDKRNVRRKVSEDEDDGTESEEERLRDQREREELEQHLRERDTARTRKLTEPKMSKKEQEEFVRRDSAVDKGDIESLRKFSWQEYMKKRKQKKVLELKDDIEDEPYLFGDEKLTEREIREFRYKREIYELIKKSTQEEDNVGEYRMPDAYDQQGSVDQEKRFAVSVQRYRDMGSAEKMNPFAEQEAWEDHQIGSILFSAFTNDQSCFKCMLYLNDIICDIN
jgi:pre-mRNA-splicing factor ATP-dependent RNA helicase DHX16